MSRAPLTPDEESIAFYFFIGNNLVMGACRGGSVLAGKPLLHGARTLLRCGDSFSIDAFYNKLKVVDRLVKAKYGEKTAHIKKWAKLFGELERLSNTRNCLAHYGSNHYPKGKPGRRFALEPRIVGSRQPQRVPESTPSGLCA